MVADRSLAPAQDLLESKVPARKYRSDGAKRRDVARLVEREEVQFRPSRRPTVSSSLSDLLILSNSLENSLYGDSSRWWWIGTFCVVVDADCTGRSSWDAEEKSARAGKDEEGQVWKGSARKRKKMTNRRTGGRTAKGENKR